MRTITTNLYLFPELTPEAQEHAIDAHRECMSSDYWWADETGNRHNRDLWVLVESGFFKDETEEGV